jgi:hypothetical protein
MGGADYPADKLQPFRTVARRCLIWIWIALAAAVVVLFLALMPALMPTEQTIPLWFQRSGSITTIGALIIGIFVNRLRDELEGRFMGDLYGQYVFKEIRLPFKIATCASVALTIIGTVVWGYGDLLLGSALQSLCVTK